MNEKKLSLSSLILLVIGSIIGAGIFSLPSELTKGSGGLAIILGFVISGVGVLCLAWVYYLLSISKPMLKNGIYSYSREGFGDYIGFNSAWIYWVSSTLGNISYATLMFGTLAYFFKAFNFSGNNLNSLIGESILIWLLTLLILSGVKKALFFNLLINVAKITPLLLFVIVGFAAFHYKNFSFQFLGEKELGSLYHQIKTTMITNLWAFGGLEAAVVLSARAKKNTDVGKATVIGLVCIILLYITIMVLSLGIMKRPDIATLHNPSLAYVFEKAIGPIGASITIIGLLVSMLGSLLAWTLITAEMPYSTAIDNVMPRFLAKENKKGTASYAIISTTVITQIWLFFSYFNHSGYEFLFSLAATAGLIPFVFSMLFFFKVLKERKKENDRITHIKYTLILFVALGYSLWLLIAAGLKYTLFSSIISVIGLIVYVINRKVTGEVIFKSKFEVLFAIIISVIAVITSFLIYNHVISVY